MASCKCRDVPVVMGGNWDWVNWGREPECILNTRRFFISLEKHWNNESISIFSLVPARGCALRSFDLYYKFIYDSSRVIYSADSMMLERSSSQEVYKNKTQARFPRKTRTWFEYIIIRLTDSSFKIDYHISYDSSSFMINDFSAKSNSAGFQSNKASTLKMIFVNKCRRSF